MPPGVFFVFWIRLVLCRRSWLYLTCALYDSGWFLLFLTADVHSFANLSGYLSIRMVRILPFVLYSQPSASDACFMANMRTIADVKNALYGPPFRRQPIQSSILLRRRIFPRSLDRHAAGFPFLYVIDSARCWSCGFCLP